MEIEEADVQHISIIQDIAKQTWATTYNHILSVEQIHYMLDMMYSPKSLLEQMTKLNHHFILIRKTESNTFNGFVSFEFNYLLTSRTKLHKLYVLPQCQGDGLGRKLIDEVCLRATECGNKSIVLNVNRYNKAYNFYKHNGFTITGEEDIDIGCGYLMQDYIFEKQL